MSTGATLKNIAKALNISISTVSRALKNHPDISEETKKKVTETARIPEYEACDKVRINDEEAATIAAERIIKSGYKKVLAIFGNPELSITRNREKTFIQILENKIQAKNFFISHATSAPATQEQTTAFLKSKNKPEVIFCMSDEVLTGVMKSIQKLKLRIPKDIAVISISNDSFIPSLFEPEITYIETSGYQLGKLTLKRILDYLGGKTFIQEVLLPPRLIEGGSI